MEAGTNKDQQALFCKLFYAYHARLHRYAYTIVKDADAASDMVQTVFINLWNQRKDLLKEKDIGSYLYKSTYNRSLNYIRDKKTRDQRAKDAMLSAEPTVSNARDKVLASQLSEKIHEVLQSLPPQCKIIFNKSRIEHKKYAEIAAELNLSIKTVEAQMGKALRIFREHLKDYL